MSKWQYTKGLHHLGNGNYAYLLPDGSWCLSNAGLIVDGDRSLLVDTLTDLPLTREMLQTMKGATAAAASIDILVNTHANADHYYGNELVTGAEIVASNEAAKEMAQAPPRLLADMVKQAPEMGELGAYVLQCFGAFNFEGITPTPPTIAFENRLDIRIGKKEVQLIRVGPAHTNGDIIVYVPGDRLLFAGDLLFNGGTPISWSGPIDGWIRACDLMLELDAETIVPGHGGITDKSCVQAIKGYWNYLKAETRKRYDSGMSADEAVADIPLGPYASWGENERIVVNIHTLYREFSGDTSPPNVTALFSSMAARGLKRT